LCGFGLLVITGTPLHRVPNRLAELRGTAADDEDADNDETVAGGRSGRKRPTAIEGGDHVRPYDSPLLPGGSAGPGRKGAALPGEASRAGGASSSPWPRRATPATRSRRPRC